MKKINSKGFTLTEILIATTLSLLVVAAIWSLFIKSFSLYSRTEGYYAAQDDARYTIRNIEKDLGSAEAVTEPTSGNFTNRLVINGIKVQGEHLTRHTDSGVYYTARQNYPVKKEIPFSITISGGSTEITLTEGEGYQIDANDRITFDSPPAESDEVTADITYNVTVTYEINEENGRNILYKIVRNPNNNQISNVRISSNLTNDNTNNRSLFSQPLDSQIRVNLFIDEDTANEPPEYQYSSVFDLKSSTYLAYASMPEATRTAFSNINFYTTYSLKDSYASFAGDRGSYLTYSNGSWSGIPGYSYEPRVNSIWYAEDSLSWRVGNGIYAGSVSGGPNGAYSGVNYTGVWFDDIQNTWIVGYPSGGTTGKIYHYHEPNTLNLEKSTNEKIYSISGKGEYIFTVGEGGHIYSLSKENLFPDQEQTDINDNLIWGVLPGYNIISQVFTPTTTSIEGITIDLRNTGLENPSISIQGVDPQDYPDGNAMATADWGNRVSDESGTGTYIPLDKKLSVSTGQKYCIVIEKFQSPDSNPYTSGISTTNRYSQGKTFAHYADLNNSANDRWDELASSLYFKIYTKKTDWQEMTNIPTTNNLYSVFMAQGNNDDYNAWAVGDQGTIIKLTSSNPDNWSLNTQFVNQSGSSPALRSVNFFDRSNGMAVGDNGTILKYLPESDTWYQLISPAGNINLNAVSLHWPSAGWIAGDNGTVIKVGSF